VELYEKVERVRVKGGDEEEYRLGDDGMMRNYD
jgi:hypothetical protein